MKLSDLFLHQILGLPGEPEHNPLTIGWIFEDAQLLDVRIDVLHSAVGALFEIRSCYLSKELRIESLNCGVMMFRKTSAVTWTNTDAKDRPNPQVWPVNACRIEQLPTGVKAHPLGKIFGMDLIINAESVEFYAGRLPALPDGIPSYPDHIDVTGLVPGWEMDFRRSGPWGLRLLNRPDLSKRLPRCC